MTVIRFPAEERNFPFLNVFGAHQASCTMGTEGCFRAVGRPDRELEQTHPSSVELKNTWSYTSIPPR